MNHNKFVTSLIKEPSSTSTERVAKSFPVMDFLPENRKHFFRRGAFSESSLPYHSYHARLCRRCRSIQGNTAVVFKSVFWRDSNSNVLQHVILFMHASPPPVLMFSFLCITTRPTTTSLRPAWPLAYHSGMRKTTLAWEWQCSGISKG